MSRTREQLRSLRGRAIPQWWRDAKLGIFVHWTPASVPGFAPVGVGIGDLLQSSEPDALKDSPYTEWYENSLRFPDSAVSRHHRATYGDRPYTEFAQDWEQGLEQWDPVQWATAFREAGAQYVVLVAKHADGYCLWPTDTPNPHRSHWHCRRDVVGEMSDAVRGAGLRFGIYYCGGFDWSFDATPIGTMSEVVRAIPRGDYRAYADAHVRELVNRYRPSVLWNDVAWPASGRDLWPLLTCYYDAVPDGVINDRWMPWSPLFATTRFALFRRAIDAGARARRATRRGADPSHAAALRFPDARVRDDAGDRTHTVGVRPRDGPQLRLQRQLQGRGFRVPRRAAMGVHRRRGQGRKPPLERWATRRRRLDPAGAVGSARLAGRARPRESRGHRGHMPVGRVGIGNARGLRPAVHGPRRRRVCLSPGPPNEGHPCRGSVNTIDAGRSPRRRCSLLAR